MEQALDSVALQTFRLKEVMHHGSAASTILAGSELCGNEGTRLFIKKLFYKFIKQKQKQMRI